jgi:glycosyltransferase involved in cell wall biosynthesis
MGKPDLIHSHNTLEGGAIAFLLSKKFGIPYIITEHSSRFLIGETFSYLERLSIKKIWRNTKLLLAVSSSLKRAIERDFECSTEIRVLHNTLEPEFVDRKKIWSVSKSQKILLVSIGRLENIKRHRMLIDAFALINAERQMKLLIFGNGSQEVSLREQIDALGQIGCIEILDGSDRNAMFTKLAQAHAMVHASQYETFGVVLIEALALGVPVLSTNSGGPADFIDGKNGVIVDVSDSRGLAIGISEFLEQIDHFDRKEISENCLKLFGHKVIAEHLAKTYETLVHKR